jgi:hypothetical protein
MNKQTIVEQTKAARAKLNSAIAGLSTDDLLRPFAVGIWSIKDLLAHLTAWESELITALSKLGKAAPAIVEIEDFDSFNQEQYEVNARRSLEVVMEDFQGAHKYLLLAIEDLDEKTLTTPNRFAWMEGEPLSYLIAENGFLHEIEHAEEILAWRQANGL